MTRGSNRQMTPNIASDDDGGKARAGPCTRLRSAPRNRAVVRLTATGMWSVPHRVIPMASSARALIGEFGAFPSRQGPRGRVPSWRRRIVLFLAYPYPSLLDANIWTHG